MSYGIYIIHEKQKVGLAANLDDRLAQQGYTRDEVEIFQEGIADLAVARMVEKTVQQALGYTKYEDGPDLVDKFLARKKLNIVNKTHFKTYEGNTIGFPYALEMFPKVLDTGCTLETSKGTYKATYGDIVKLNNDRHFRKSKFSNGNLQTYIYCKVIDNYFANKQKPEANGSGRVDALLSDIHNWADDRGILRGKIETQTLKLGEEFGELQKAVLKDKPEDIKDAIGDIIVVLVSIAYFNGHTIADALQMAYDTISKRTGYTNDKGDFIKTKFNGKEIKDTL